MRVEAFPREAPGRAQYATRLGALAIHLVEQQLVPYARARTVLADLFGASLSPETLAQWVQQAARALVPVDAQVKAALAQVPVLHSAATGVHTDALGDDPGATADALMTWWRQ